MVGQSINVGHPSVSWVGEAPETRMTSAPRMPLGPWKSADAVEWETLKWVDGFNNRRLLEPIGYITPTEAEEAFYANMNILDKVA